jgi:FMN phosphatase YigB (HAD superfamily)
MAVPQLAGAGDFAVLSCDIFDTVLYRRLARPADLFLAVGLRAARAGVIGCAPEAFALHRVTAEQRVRARVEAAGDDEPLMLEIYAELAACGVVSDAAAGEALEFAAECAACVAVPEMLLALRALAGSAGAPRIVFVSDTVWPAERLTALLRSCCYDFDFRVFCSADARRSKHTGRLFDVMLAALGQAPARILHVGDNPHSDVVQPRAKGITARHIPRRRPQPAPPEGDAVTRLCASVARVNAAGADWPEGNGPQAAGVKLAALATPIMIGLALFVLGRARALGTRRIYFIARDGYLPLAFCQRLAGDDAPGWDFSYLAVSRAALQEAQAARDYLEQEGFARPGTKLVVDLGWNGSTQTRLAEICGLARADLHGAYLGLWEAALRPALPRPQAQGYFCDFGLPARHEAALAESYLAFELLFSAPHGTVLGYRQGDDGTSVPVLETEIGPQGDARRIFFSAFESACLANFDVLDNIIGGAWPPAIQAAAAFAPLEQPLTRPSHEDLALINGVPFVHGDGRLRAAVNPLPWHEALRHPARSWRRLEKSPWRAGALRAALPWPSPFVSFTSLQAALARVRRIVRA